ncbi:centromere protein M [Microcaecilia unicolor]|uniref:Centromere protein M n=1 Tax=Microcaecilia unicolor TaxID=1415580 RepID=A0A6P7X5P8_9AMPH|nr:centromere protein M [Microcaecilia unicolor]
MSVLKPFDKMPVLNMATVLFVGTEESHKEQLAEAMLKESKTFDVKIHLAKSLPLPAENDNLRPRIDLIVFLINLQSQLSYATVISSLSRVDANFFLGKVCFLATGGGQMKHTIVEMSTVKKLADSYLSILLFSELNSERDCCHTAQRLLQMLRICAGHVPGVSALYLGSMMRLTSPTSEAM